MELRQRPYFPLYVQDFLSDEKLAECSAESTGVYIRLLCIMHKSEDYGSISLKAKDKKYPDPITNFALKLTRQMPYIEDVIERSLAELIEEGVLCIDGDRLFQKRMVRDGQSSENKAEAGRKGGKASKTQAEPEAKAKQNLKQNSSKTLSKTQADSENENEIENDNKDISIDINNKTIDNLETEDIVEVYNKTCPELYTALPKLIEGAKEKIRECKTLLKSSGKSWTDYFQMVHDSDFLSGRNGRWTACHLNWLLQPDNMTKVLNGNYANRAAPAPVESLWKELQKAAKKMAGLYSPYACVGSGEERYTGEQIEAWKQDCWNDLPDQLKQFVGNIDELAAIGKLDPKKQEQTVLPRLRRYLGG